MTQLVQPLFTGPLDIVGDIHGEIDALGDLLGQLGYAEDGSHPRQRRLVFVGDLTDRGPDSPAVIDFVQRLVKAGRAQCVLGNHDLNILLGHHKHDNHWFYGEPWALDRSVEPTPAVLADDEVRGRVLKFFRSLPLVLERSGLRVVHACWKTSMVDMVRDADDVVGLYETHRQRINAQLRQSDPDPIDRELEHQNHNPVKVITSGTERRVETPFEASGKLRYEERVPWWHDYQADDLCIFGHYSLPQGKPHSFGKAHCIDYAVAKRWIERKAPHFDGTFQAKLAALRIPEMTVIFDDGETDPLPNLDE
ncbi:MAG: hypothetical protein CMJ59_17995 [Planctomycetaceae bacterium]|nr:hypothetical protein [Planctomycetaceae bacterium]